MRTALVVVIMAFGWQVSADICVQNLDQIQNQKYMEDVKVLMPSYGSYGFVNKTKGSFLWISSTPQGFSFEFYTSGLFDLYGISRQGKLEFCAGEEKLIVKAIDKKFYVDPQALKKGQIVLDSDKDSRIFVPGPMPELLVELHGVSDPEKTKRFRGIANED